MKTIVYMLGFLLLGSCTSNTILEKPKDLISKDKMANILTDLFLATGAKSVKNIEGKRRLNYMPQVYEKYKIDSTQFKESNYYYTSLIDVNTEILTLVENRMNHLKDSLNKIERTLDSIKRHGSKSLKDSLIQLKGDPLLDSKTSENPPQLIAPRAMLRQE